MPSPPREQKTIKLPGNHWYGLSFLAGIAVYLLLSYLNKPGFGIPLGVITWFILTGQAIKLSNRSIIRHADEMFALGQAEEALNYLRQITEKYKGHMEVHDYYECKLKQYNPEVTSEAAATIVPTGYITGTITPETVYRKASLETGSEMTPDLAENDIPKLSFRSVLILTLLPFVFLPIFRQTFPYVGLWPALVIIISSVSVIKLPNRWNRAIGKIGLSLAILSLIFFGISLLSKGIPGKAPDFKLDFKSEKTDWIVKIFSFVVLIFSIVLHEIAHAWAAFFSGDSTAKDQGRINLNPIKHVDLFGTIILPATMYFLPGGVVFGWAKPVPVMSNNFRNYRRGQLAVSLAGVATNALIAMFSCSMLISIGILLHRCYPLMSVAHFTSPWIQVTLTGVPYAGIWVILIEIFKAGIITNMVLFSLNIIPIPPLDGYGILEGLVFKKLRGLTEKFRKWGSAIFLVLIFTHIIDYLVIPGILIAFLFFLAAGHFAKFG